MDNLLICRSKKLLCFMEKLSATALVKRHMAAKGIKTSFLSEKLYGDAGKTHSSQTNLSQKLKKEDLSVGLLYDISIALGHNFFYDLAQDKSLPQPPSTEMSIDQLIDKKLAEKLRGK